LLLRGQLLLITAKSAETSKEPKEKVDRNYEQAKRAIENARKNSPEKPDAWIALVWYYMNSNQKSTAEKVIEDAKTKINPTDKSLALAQCYEILGDLEKASAQYESAKNEQPEDLAVLRNMARFELSRLNFAKAYELYQKIAKIDPGSTEDKRQILVL